jgi:Na+/H+-dicarboxylate symporter
VIPTGYSFNLTGSSLYLSMAAVFVAQAAGIHLSIGRQIEMLLVLMVASKGVAGVPRAVLVVLLATAASIGLPSGPILLILGVDTVIDMGRTMLNVLGNCLASAVVAGSEKQLEVANL